MKNNNLQNKTSENTKQSGNPQNNRETQNSTENKPLSNSNRNVSLGRAFILGYIGAQILTLLLIMLSVIPTWTALIPISVAILFVLIPISGLLAIAIAMCIAIYPLLLLKKLLKRR